MEELDLEKKDTKTKLEELAKQDEIEEHKKEIMESKKALTIKERLLKRKQNVTIDVTFSDGDDDFVIPVKLLSPKEQNEVLALQLKLVDYRNRMKNASKLSTEKMKEMIKQGQTLMATYYDWVAKICADDSLTAEFWKKGDGYSAEVPATLIQKSIQGSRTARTDLSSFRKNRQRTRTLSTADGV
jgi:hypothetical protein